jgi:hypothetical protein
MQADITIEYSAKGMAHLVAIIPIRDADGIGSTEEVIYEAASTLNQSFAVASEIISNHLTGGQLEPDKVSSEIRWRRINDNYWTGTITLEVDA